MDTEKILHVAADLISGDRAVQHGDKRELHMRIARFWNLYLHTRPGRVIVAADVAVMMALLKIARTTSGAFNTDNYIDGAAYIAIAGELAQPENQDAPS